MIIHQDTCNKEYTVNFHEKYIEVIINFIPEDNYIKGELFFNISIYFDIDNTIIKYKDKAFTNKEDLKLFFKSFNNRKLSI